MLFYPSILWIYASFNPISITRKHHDKHQSLASVWCEVQEPTLRSGEHFSNDIRVVTVGDKTTNMKVYQQFLLRVDIVLFTFTPNKTQDNRLKNCHITLFLFKLI